MSFRSSFKNVFILLLLYARPKERRLNVYLGIAVYFLKKFQATFFDWANLKGKKIASKLASKSATDEGMVTNENPAID